MRSVVVGRVEVGWCSICRTNRVLLNVRAWPADWGADGPPPTGECSTCGNTIAAAAGERGPAA